MAANDAADDVAFAGLPMSRSNDCSFGLLAASASFGPVPLLLMFLLFAVTVQCLFNQ